MNRRGLRMLVSIALIAGSTLVGPLVGTGDAAPAAEAGSSDWVRFTAGKRHTCGIRTTGRLYCWGSDGIGQGGDGGSNAVTHNTPVEVSGGATNWTQVAAGGLHTCGIRNPGRLYCWGYDGDGELGNGPGSGDQTTPQLVTGGFADWTSVSATEFHTCAIRGTGRLYCWGSDGDGRLGIGAATGVQQSPVQVGAGTNWTSVAASETHTCGIRNPGRLYCWGSDVFAQLGNGAATGVREAPVQVGGATDWTIVTTGYDHTCGRRANGRVYCWGSDAAAQLGNGPESGPRDAPDLILSNFADWVSVTAGEDHTCARRANSRLYCWGTDGEGQIGDAGTSTTRDSATQVAGGATDWTTVESGTDHVCARIRSGRLFCWGQDAFVQLGDNDATGTAKPYPVSVWA